MPLSRGRYPLTNSLWSALGRPTNVVQSDVPARTNLEYTGLTELADTSNVLQSGVMAAVLVPVDVGLVVSKVSVLVGGVAASTPTHSFAAVYAGTTVAAPALIGQSGDGTTSAIAANARFDFSFFPALTVTGDLAPNGYVWVAVSVSGTAMPSLGTAGSSTGLQYPWFANYASGSANAALSITSGSAVAGTAPATLVYASRNLFVPIVFLT